MSASNPSHLLISRNPRSPAHPQLAPTTSTSVVSPGPGSHLFTFPQSTSPEPGPSSAPFQPHFPHQRSQSTPALSSTLDSPLLVDDESDAEAEDDDDIEIHPTFRPDSALPGRVKVVVGRHTFWCHKEVLWFSSPFFNALLQGSWAETRGTSGEEAQPPSSPTDTDLAHTDIDGGRRSRSEGHATEQEEPAAILEPAPKPAAGPSSSAILPERETAASDSGHKSHKSSVYLDALDDGPSVADILRELREMPDPRTVTTPLEALLDRDRQSPLTRPSSSPLIPLGSSSVPTSPMAQPRRSTESQSPLSSSLPRSSALLPPPLSSPPLALQPGHTLPAPPAVTTALARRRGPSSSYPEQSAVLAWPGSKHHVGLDKVDAVVELHESPSAFQDFLFWAYPHLECKVTWTNVEGLLALSSKLLVPALQKLCEHFLMTHASGRPIVALSLAELHGNAELFREASRFVLDQATWDPAELESLSEQTQLKLSKRRTWFLERLLKLGSIDVKKEYTCRPDCPDASRCSSQLDEKWRQAHQAVSRYGPPQPSVAFRCLRQLETFPTNPSLVMPHPLCQSTAKGWVMTLFDRMFQPKMSFSTLSPGTEKVSSSGLSPS
ncbi:uncharacterized protein LOC62_04G005502 [Vanrija pseudolonga]|uniref:BTB domain-containing protein n=1 Tax=Vanrija pseudolonga TaxID=143232 RepID=A0AAF0Y8R2_9TREE|nr:hypothetical protein LOC62_04G005502 [Vanrija pseudolonga]